MAGNKSLALALGIALLSPEILAQTHRTVRHVRVTENAVSPEVLDAEAALARRDYAAAEKLLKPVTAAHAEDARAWFDLGVAQAGSGEKPDAVASYRKSLALKSSSFEPNLNLGLLLASLGNFAEAAPYLRQATQLVPSDPSSAQQSKFAAWYALGKTLESSAPADSLHAYQHALALEPKDMGALLAVGELEEKSKDWAGAEKAYQVALGVEPASEEALRGLVNVYIATRQTAKAKEELARYIAADPRNAQAHVLLAQILSAEGKYEDALGQLQAAQKLAPSDDKIARQLAGNAALAGKYDLAENEYTKLIAQHPSDAELHFALGTALMRDKKFAQSEPELIEALKLDPTITEAYGNLATVAAENHHYALALKALDLRARSLPESPGTYFLRATSLDHLRRYKEASQNYKLFLAADSGKFPDQEWQARHRLMAIDPDRSRQ